MLHILYTGPRGRTTINPDEEFLRYVIYRQPWLEWYKSPNNNASLEVLEVLVEPSKDDPPPKRRWWSPMEGKNYRVSHDHPTLVLKQPESDEFLAMWWKNGVAFVPYKEMVEEDIVFDHCGGDDLPIPRACLTSADETFAIVQEFVTTTEKLASIRWVNWDDVAIPPDE